jgi:hypothetical protein
MNVIARHPVHKCTYKFKSFDILWPRSQQPLRTLGCGLLWMKEFGLCFILSKLLELIKCLKREMGP